MAAVRLSVAGPAALAVPHHESGTKTILITSGPSWRTWHEGHFIGMAENVCLNMLVPANCPPGAVVYGFAGSEWSADLSPIPGATWIWAPGISGQTPNASLNSYRFKRKINIHGQVVNATAYVATDDLARIKVNGNWVGRWGSVTDPSKSSVAHANLKSLT